jgi:DNA-binding MarR family transcriptional regulator
MSTAKPKFSEALDEWVEVFMNRSMRDTWQFWKESGLSMPQIGTMMKLRYMGTCGVTDVADHLGVTNAAASQMIEKLFQAGYLERTEHPDDRRAKQLTLTKQGRALIQKSLDARRRWLEDLVRALSPDEQAEIAAALAQLTKAARDLDSAFEKA